MILFLAGAVIGGFAATLVVSLMACSATSSWQDAAGIMAGERDQWRAKYHELAAKNQQEGEGWKE